MVTRCENAIRGDEKLNGMIEKRDIKGFEGKYQVSSNGSIFSVERTVTRRDWKGNNYSYVMKGKEMKVVHDITGYIRVSLYNGTKHRFYLIHRLVAHAFIGDPLPNQREVNHKNGIKSDNRLENLEWCTSSQNKIHAYKNNLWSPPYGEKCGTSKLKEKDVKDIRCSNEFQRVLADRYGVHINTISDIQRRKKWKNLV